MADWSQFDEMNRKRTAECELCEEMCPDAVDGTLTEAEQRVFDRHVAGCVSCAKELEEAQRGAAWMGMLKGHTPEPPAALLAKILAETTGAEAGAHVQHDETPQAWGTHSDTAAGAVPVMVPGRDQAPAWALSSVMRRVGGVFRIESARSTFQPRMAMTTAMAFVSIAMTLNLTGVRLGDLRASSLTPSAIRRSVANAGASAERGFQNMRVVYQVESRVSELRGEGPLAEREVPLAEPQPTQDTNSGTTQPENAPAPRRKGL
ncbi:MAG TPA: zf-HC2 domain-containing protein [Acidobacteriaceae bacterium]|nr:zf-HC2 domain-containing protein [Acidobacteriaceae bacterium]